MDTRAGAARLTIVVLLTTCIVAGVDRAQAATIGAQIGVDRAGIDGDTPPNISYSDEFGIVAGVQGEIDLPHDLALSLQPAFVRKKTKGTVAIAGGQTLESDLTFDYISVPLVVKFAQAGGRTYVAGGVAADFLSTARLEFNGSAADVKDAFSSTGLGAVLGFGVVFPVGGTRLTTELRYVQGISNMTKGSVAAAAGALAPRLHSTGWELIVGDLLSIGGH